MSQLIHGPYTPVKNAEKLFWTSGQVGVDPTTKQAPKGIESQTSQALTNLQSVLETKGLTMKDVIKTTVFLTSMDHYNDMNNVYQGLFEVPMPARTCVAVAELPRVGGKNKLLIEIEAVAFSKDK